jgi:hypothetical protein
MSARGPHAPCQSIYKKERNARIDKKEEMNYEEMNE